MPRERRRAVGASSTGSANAPGAMTTPPRVVERDCLKNWRIAALLSIIFGLGSFGGMAWLGKGFFRALNATRTAGELAPAIAASASPSATSNDAGWTPNSSSDAGNIYYRSKLVPMNWRVIKRWPHDSSAFTQGLVWRGDRLYEGTGLYGQSRLRRVNILGGAWAVEAEVPLASRYFGEGIVVWTDKAGTWLPPHENGTARDIVIQVLSGGCVRGMPSLSHYAYSCSSRGKTARGSSTMQRLWSDCTAFPSRQ